MVDVILQEDKSFHFYAIPFVEPEGNYIKQTIIMENSLQSSIMTLCICSLINSICFQNHIFFDINIELVKDDNNNYDKIKHLVEVDDDILAVFIIVSLQIRDLYIAKSAHVDRECVNSIFDALGSNYSDVTRD